MAGDATRKYQRSFELNLGTFTIALAALAGGGGLGTIASGSSTSLAIENAKLELLSELKALRQEVASHVALPAHHAAQESLSEIQADVRVLEGKMSELERRLEKVEHPSGGNR